MSCFRGWEQRGGERSLHTAHLIDGVPKIPGHFLGHRMVEPGKPDKLDTDRPYGNVAFCKARKEGKTWEPSS